LFEDDHVRIIYKHGQSDYVLVTFGDMVTKLDGDRFYADVPAEKAGMAAIGFVAKKENWFPAASIGAGAEAIRSLLQRFSTVITYGGSMGGYGAIKYSAMLGADLVIALCPQWSLDAQECGFEPGWQQHYQPSMAQMGIRPSDVAGRVFLLADLGHALDRAHAGKIAQAVPDLRIINFPSVDHHVTTVLAGTENLIQLLEACRVDDLDGIRRIVRRSRQYHLYRFENLTQKAQRRHPSLLYRGLGRWVGTDAFARWWVSSDLLDQFAACCRSFGDREREAAIIARRCGIERDPVKQAYFALLHAIVTGEPVSISTHHGTRLRFDQDSGTVRHGVDSTARTMALRHRVIGRTLRLQIEGAGLDLNLMMAAGQLRVASDGIEGEMQPVEPGAFALRFGDHYLSAEPGGRLVANRSQLQAWEIFRFLP